VTAAPPLAGLCSYQEAARTDGSVEEAVRFLRRLARYALLYHAEQVVMGRKPGGSPRSTRPPPPRAMR
jgi:hypothetical protein